MTNLSPTIIAKSDQLNSDDLIGRSITIKVTKVSLLAGEQPISIHYEGDEGKPWKPCKSMRRVLVQLWGSDGSVYAGRSLTLYRDPTVRFGPDLVGGIRISHMSHINAEITMALTATKAKKKPFTVKPLVIQDTPAQGTPTATGSDPDIEAYKKAGYNAAKLGVASLKTWWSGIGATPQQKLGAAFLEELKTNAKHADSLKTNAAPSANTQLPPQEDSGMPPPSEDDYR